MKTRYLPLIVLASLGAFIAAPLHADDDKDHELARQALARGEILSLSRILELAAAAVPGDVIEVDLDRDDGRFIYEIKVLATSGRVRELELDARTGELLKLEDD